MYEPPVYLWILTIAGPVAIAAWACIALYAGAIGAGLERRRAVLITGAAVVVFGGWFIATAVIAGRGWYDTRSDQVPWLAVAVVGYLGTLLALSRVPMVARALHAPGMAARLVLPHSFRVAGVFFLLYMALGHLPALFALPAGLGDIATGIAAPFVARRLRHGTAGRAAIWFNVYGIIDVVTSLTIGTLLGFGIPDITPSIAPINELPLAIVTTANVPLMVALNLSCLFVLARASRSAPAAPSMAGALTSSGAAPRAVR
ncbi:hypothetical protein GCM10009630_21520 [Kribbella jejuensis]|uniref:Uncharacterized protein n=1 Tax=Kribbella jejuensis TaxID=236068 RepID=A0A542DSV0_9ACTN|nr:hypothetical protein [Kribbella jejuensis]TQJ06179.1 hypothetical protein FB475_5832 [Kribbella jejuensis]